MNNAEALSDLRGMMVIMRKTGHQGTLRFTVTRTYAREIWSELRENGVDMPLPNIGDIVRLEFNKVGLVAMEVL